MSKRIAIGSITMALVAVGASAAFKIAASHSSTLQPTAAGPSTTADPHRVVPAAWLAPDQLPLAQTFGWTAVVADPQGPSPIGRPLTSTVFYVANNTRLQALTTCADPTQLLGRTTGAQHTDFTTSTGTAGDEASQFVFFFDSATSARQGFAWLQSQYGPSCPQGSGTTVERTAGNGVTDSAWLIDDGPSTASDLPAYTREYFVLRGSTIAYVSVSTDRGGLPVADGDAARLSAIAAHLCVYGGSCH